MTDPKPGDTIGGYRLIAIDPEPLPYLGQKRLWCDVECISCEKRARRILTLLVNHKPAMCRKCTAAHLREMTVVLPTGEAISWWDFRRRFPRSVAILKEVRMLESKASTKKKAIDDLPVRDRARSLLADGWDEVAVAEALDLKVPELRQLLRG